MILNVNKLMDRIDGCPDLLTELVPLFQQTFSQSLRELAAAVETGDAKMISQISHSMAGSASSMSGEKVTAVARAIHDAGTAGELILVDQLQDELRSEFDAFQQELQELVRGGSR